MGNRGKDSIWELRVLSTCSMNAQNLPLFLLKFTDQMENWGEEGIWELTVLAGRILKIYTVFLEFIEFIEKFIWHVGIYSFYEMNFF